MPPRQRGTGFFPTHSLPAQPWTVKQCCLLSNGAGQSPYYQEHLVGSYSWIYLLSWLSRYKPYPCYKYRIAYHTSLISEEVELTVFGFVHIFSRSTEHFQHRLAVFISIPAIGSVESYIQVFSRYVVAGVILSSRIELCIGWWSTCWDSHELPQKKNDQAKAIETNPESTVK